MNGQTNKSFKKTVSNSKVVTGTKRFFKDHGADIFSVLAGIGVIATGVSAYNAGRAAIDENDSEFASTERNKKKSLIKPISFGTGTIASIYAARKFGKLKEESLLAACSVLALYSQRKGQTDSEIRKPVGRSRDFDASNIESTGTGDQFFTEDLTGRTFTASLEYVQDAIKRLQDEFERHNFVPLNSFYGYLGISTTSAGDILGWSVNQSILDPYLDEEDYNDMKDALTDLGIFVRYYEGLGYVIHYSVMPIGGLPGVGPCDY